MLNFSKERDVCLVAVFEKTIYKISMKEREIFYQTLYSFFSKVKCFDKKHIGKKCFYTYPNVLIMKEKKILLPQCFSFFYRSLLPN